MDKIVGKLIIFIIALSTSAFLCARIALCTVDMHGRNISHAQAGTPFKLELSLDGEDGKGDRPHLRGAEGIQVYGRESKMQIINGQRSTKHLYVIRIDKPGTYTMGPMEVMVDGKAKQSDTVQIVVTDAPPASNTDSGKSESAPQVFTRLSCDKKNIIVGEKAICSLRVYCQDDATQIREILEPEWGKNIRLGTRRGPIASKQMVDGINYTCIEWQWDFFPTASGELTIPAFRGDFAIPLETDDGGAYNFMPFFGRRSTQKRIYSNAITVHVDPLPHHKGPIHAVGRFSNFNATIKPPVAREGEGMVLTLTLDGEHDAINVEALSCTNMPDALKWYDSKTYTDQLPDGTQRRCSEYIVQGLKAGDWKIPPQQFTYFDTGSRSYTTLETLPIVVTIVAQPERTTNQPALSAHLENDEQPTNSEIDEDLSPLNTAGPWYAEQQRYIPWWLFTFILLAPVVWLWRDALRYQPRNQSDSARAKKAFAKARSSLAIARKKQQVSQLYIIFVELFADKFCMAPADITHDTIDELMRTAGFTHEQLSAWNDFFAQLAESVYYTHKRPGSESITQSGKQSGINQFDAAQQWLIILEKKL